MSARTFWQIEFPVGDANRGSPFGERLDPATVGMASLGMQGAGMAMNLIGSSKASSAASGVGAAYNQEAQFEATQMRQQAGQEIAASQRTAFDQARTARLVASRAQAVAAASGGGATDPTVLKVISDINGEGVYRAGVALYGGKEKARVLEMGAETKTYEGEVAAAGGEMRSSAYQIAGLGSLATGGASFLAKYGQGGFKSGTTDAGTSNVGGTSINWDLQ